MFSEIVVVFSKQEVRLPPRGLAGALHEIYKIREFCLAFCLETMEQSGVTDLRTLRLATQRVVGKGSYDFLTHPPVVFSRAHERYDHFVGRIREL